MLLSCPMPFNRLNHSILGEIRPRFQLKINCEAEKAVDHVCEKLRTDNTVSGDKSRAVLFVRTPKHISHYWSPEMTVRIEKDEFQHFTSVNCLIGPRQTVWAMFAFIYSAIALVTFFGGIFGYIQYQSDGHSIWLWVIPIGFALWSTLFITSKLGQRKGRDEMLHLVSFLYHSLNEISEVERVH